MARVALKRLGRRRRLALVAPVALVMLAALGYWFISTLGDRDEVAPTTTQPAGVPSAGAPTASRAWESVALVGARRLTVSFVGADPRLDRAHACWVDYRLAATEQAERVVLTLQASPAPATLIEDEACSLEDLEDHPRSVDVELAAPLRGRRVYDGNARQRGPVAVAGPLSEVTVIPDEWELRSGSGTSNAEGWVWSRAYGPGAGERETSDMLTIVEGASVDIESEQPPDASRPLQVRGHEGQLVSFDRDAGARQLMVFWRESDRDIAVSLFGVDIDEATVIAIADGLRVPAVAA